jgi:hypothetical protein
MANEEMLRNEIESLKAENTRLREFNTLLQAQRKEYLDILCGPAEKYVPSEEEVEGWMKDLVPFDRFLAENGITRQGTAS